MLIYKQQHSCFVAFWTCCSVRKSFHWLQRTWLQSNILSTIKVFLPSRTSSSYSTAVYANISLFMVVCVCLLCFIILLECLIQLFLSLLSYCFIFSPHNYYLCDISSSIFWHQSFRGTAAVCTWIFRLIQGHMPVAAKYLENFHKLRNCFGFSLTTKHFSVYSIEAKGIHLTRPALYTSRIRLKCMRKQCYSKPSLKCLHYSCTLWRWGSKRGGVSNK